MLKLKGKIAISLVFIGIVSAFIARNFIVEKTVTGLELDRLDLPKLQIGDVILRMGVVADSYIIANTSNSKFSHCGIVVNVNPVEIVHATTDDVKGSENQVIKSSLESFVALSSNIGVVRYPFDAKYNKDLQELALSKLHIPFSFSETEGYYCTTFVIDMLDDFTSLHVKRLDKELPFYDEKLFFPQTFIDDKSAKLIYSYK